MRTLFYFTLTVLIIMLAYFLYRQCANAYYATDAVVLIDQTENDFISKPDTEVIKNLLPKDETPWDGYRFRLVALSDVDFNPVFEAELKPACQYLSNSYSRQDETNTFAKKINDAFQRILDSPSRKKRSSLYVPLSAELTRIAKSKAQRRIAVIYSDLMENSSLLSFYKTEQVKLLKENPDSVKKILESENRMPLLNGIEVHLIYQPRNAMESDLFRTVALFYKKWLEEKGANVTIGANLIL